MGVMTLDRYKQLVERQAGALLAGLQSLALGDLDARIEIPEGIDALSDLAVGIQILVDDLRELMAGQVRLELVEEQSRALLDVVQSVAMGDLGVEVQVPEGVEVLSELAVGMEMMVDDLRETTREQQLAVQELKRSQEQLQTALADMLATQQRYLRQEWSEYVDARTSSGYVRAGDREGPAEQEWLPAMALAVAERRTSSQSDAGVSPAVLPPGPRAAPDPSIRGQVPDPSIRGQAREAQLAVPLQLYGEVLGVMGFAREASRPWGRDEIAAVEAVLEQVALALESQRLFDEEQRARNLLAIRIQELDCLNDIGRRIDEVPAVADLLEWLAGRIPAAMQHPELCRVAIEFEDKIYSPWGPELLALPRQMVQGLQVGAERVGRIVIAYTEDRSFLDEESALLGDIARRVNGYIENRRLLEETRAALAEVEATHRSYLRRGWQEHLRQQQMLERSGLVFDRSTVEDATHPQQARRSGEGGQILSRPDLWRPEMEHALREGRPARSREVKPSNLLAPTPGLPTVAAEASREAAPVQAGEVSTNLATSSPEQEARSGLAVPITLRGQTLGVLGVEAVDGGRQWTEDDVMLMQAVSEQLAQTLETARLFADTQRSAERERLLGEITAKIRSSTDMRDILETAATELGQALGTSRALVRVSVEGLEPSPEVRPSPHGLAGDRRSTTEEKE